MSSSKVVPDSSTPNQALPSRPLTVAAASAPQGEPTPAEDRISIPAHVEGWDEYFLNVAKAISIKSKDEVPVGAVIVSGDNVILSAGFNGMARGVYDDEEILADKDEKRKIVCHAEGNAISNAARVGGRSLEGATIYVTKFPCISCCNAIIQAGIKRIYTHDNSFWNGDPLDKDHSRKKKVLHESHVEVDAPYHEAFKPKEQILVPKRKNARKPQVKAPASQMLPLKED